MGLTLILVSVSWFKIFSKAGQAGWKALVPFFNIFIYTKIVNKPIWWFIIYLIIPIGYILSAFEVSKFLLEEPITALELYERCASRHPEVTVDKMPLDPLSINGVPAVRYIAQHWPYEVGLGKAARNSTPIQCSTYLTVGNIGWEIQLWAEYSNGIAESSELYAEQEALLFTRIAPSFKTL